MHVGLVVYGDLDRRSGGYLYDTALVEQLRRSGEEVTVFSLPERRYVTSLTDNFDRAFRRRLRRADLDVLVQDELCHPSLVWANRRLDIDAPVVALVHHLRSAEQYSPWRTDGYRAIERRYLSSVDGFVYNSETTRETVAALTDPDPGVVAVPAGDRFERSVTPERVRQRAAEGPLRLVALGNVTPRKGLDTLVTGLARTTGDWELTIVGDDSVNPAYSARLRDRITALGLDDAVTLTGRLTDDEVAAVLERSHLLTMPSQYEGFGIAYVEGMRFGLPALASTAGGAHEVVTDRVTGFLVDPGDASAVVDAVAPLCRNRERLARMGVAALETASGHPTWAETGERIQEFLQSLVAGAHQQ